MSSSEWREVTFGEISEMKYGKMPRNELVVEKGYPIYSGYRVTGYYKEFMFEEPQLIVVARGVGGTGDVKLSPPKCYLTNLSIAVMLDENIASKKYFYYYFQKMNLRNLDTGSAQSQITISDLKKYKVIMPKLVEQKAIADTLSCLDDKIELNNKINKNLEETTQAIFKSWFIDFEPFKDGEFEDSELGRIPKGWRVGTIGEIIELFDSKRIPLSSRQREVMEKKYPYYGAASLMDYVDDYIFDGIYVLLGEDGTVVDNNGYPILQYVWGKFWVNNHAHILKGKNGFNEDSIYMLLKNTSFQGIVTGAVQPKINQANLKSLKVLIPPYKKILEYNNLLDPIFAEKRRGNEENLALISIRDTLLPKLMSGEIRVPLEEVI